MSVATSFFLIIACASNHCCGNLQLHRKDEYDMTNFESLSAEVILRILGQAKDARDIVRFRQANKRMYSLGHDSILWKEMFIDTFLTLPSNGEEGEENRPSKRARKTIHDELDMQTLPIRALTSLPSIEDVNDRRTDWHALYRISWNWKKGSFNLQQLNAAMQMAQKTDQIDTAKSKLDLPNTIIESTEKFIFTAMRKSTSSGFAKVSVYPAELMKSRGGTNEEEVLQVATFSSTDLNIQDKAKISVSAIAIDQGNVNADQVRLMTGYTNGLLSISIFCPSSKTFHELASYRQIHDQTTVTAAFAWPFVATCTIDFHIRIYRLNEEGPTTLFKLIAERRSYSCHWPACLRLDRAKQNENAFCLTIVYSNPIYPSGWSVGLQELYLDKSGVIDSRSASAKRSYVVTKIDAPTKALPSKNSSSRPTSIDQVGRLTSLSYEDPFVVVGSRDNGVFCFRVDKGKDNYGSEALSIRYLRTLHGHTGSVHSVSLNGGRCVTGGSDGKVQVWYLGDEEALIARATGVISMLKGRIRSNLGKVTSLRLSDARSERKRRQKRKLSDATNSEDEASNWKPLTLADIRKHHIYPSTKSPIASQPMHVIRWVTSAFDRIISVTSNERYRYEDREHSAILPSSCRVEAQHEGQNEDESVQIWNFAA